MHRISKLLHHQVSLLNNELREKIIFRRILDWDDLNMISCLHAPTDVKSAHLHNLNTVPVFAGVLQTRTEFNALFNDVFHRIYSTQISTIVMHYIHPAVGAEKVCSTQAIIAN
jgi:hypothetical protein